MKILALTFAIFGVMVSGLARATDLSACIACHNDKMIANPILDGQHAKYIEKQLHDLKKDLRVHAQMQGIAKTLDDKQIVEVSKAFASKKWANQSPKSNPAVQEEGKNLVRKGNCTRCHGSELEGTYNIPRLAGQRAQYLKTTLLQYKNKERNNFPPMSSMLNRYSEEEIGVMAEYIAGLAYQE
ncbi:c-type cytochrome [Betaproteobacteria bacterium]|nr:c-type cytochrome [Betaproteobacteria bacterium]